MVSALVLTFHEIAKGKILGEGARPCGSFRYRVSETQFRKTIDQIEPARCCTVAELSNLNKDAWLILSFDDGFISDYEIAFPNLASRDLKGTFFVTIKNIGHPGYTSMQQLREMADGGMEIGSHGLTHRYLVTMPRSEAIREIRESKDRLEQQVGIRVCSFAPVGGHFRKWMVEAAYHAGYRYFVTMIPGKTIVNHTGPVLLKRNHIQAHHDLVYLSGIVSGHKGIFLLNRLQYTLFDVSRRILGIGNYDRVKERLLKSLS